MNKFLSFVIAVSMLLFSSPLALAAADITPPTEPDITEVIPGNGQVTVKWSVSPDASDTKGYKLYYGDESVQDTAQSYDTSQDVGNVLQYTVTALTNGKTYYFAVTAYDSAGNESVNYSFEANATPKATATDSVAPTVSKSQSLSNTQVVVEFSEAVTLPQTKAEEAFTIEVIVTSEVLKVGKAEIDPEDSTGKTVLLTTDPQEDGTEYLLTVGIEVEDLAGNPIESGESDTAQFIGKAVSQEPTPNTGDSGTGVPQADTTAPTIITASSISSTQVEILFSEAVVIDGAADSLFTITEEDASTQSLSVYSASLSSDSKSVVLTTEEQISGTSYVVMVRNVTDATGNMISSDPGSSTASFTYATKTEADQDRTPPEGVTNLIVKVEENVATLTWKASENSASDLASYVVYLSTNGGKSYGLGEVVSASTTTYTKALDPDLNYTFKVTARDNAGNENSGVTTAFCRGGCELPVTGPSPFILLFASLALAFLFMLMRRRAFIKVF